MKFEKETGIYKGRFSASELGGSTYTFEQVTGLYIKGERELFASQWTQGRDPHRESQSIGGRRETGRRNVAGESITGKKNTRKQMGRTVLRDRFSEKHQQQREVPEEYQQKQQTTEAQPETLQTESLQRRQRQGRQRREQPKARHCGRQRPKPQYDWRYEWEKLDKSPGNELVFGLAL